MKDLFNYEVSRDPSDRLNDFMDWAVNIMVDIGHVRDVLNNPIKKIFYYSWFVNYL